MIDMSDDGKVSDQVRRVLGQVWRRLRKGAPKVRETRRDDWFASRTFALAALGSFETCEVEKHLLQLLPDEGRATGVEGSQLLAALWPAHSAGLPECTSCRLVGAEALLLGRKPHSSLSPEAVDMVRGNPRRRRQ